MGQHESYSPDLNARPFAGRRIWRWASVKFRSKTPANKESVAVIIDQISTTPDR
jgi:hypothetical protein